MSAASVDRFASPASTSLDELVQLRPLAVSLARRRRRSAAPRSGATASRRLGRGLDFAEVREYQPGDDVRMIDWKVTARTQRTHTKLFVEETERPLHLVVDARASMRFGTRGCYKSVLAARLAAVFGWSAVAARERVGGLVFTDDWHAEVRPRTGRAGLMGVFRAMVQAQNRVPAPGRQSLSRALDRLATLVHPGGAVVLFSDFADLDGDAARALGGPLASRVLTAVRTVDALDRDLPVGRRLAVATLPSRQQRELDTGAAAIVSVGTSAQRARHRARFEATGHALHAALAPGRHRCVTVDTAQSLEQAFEHLSATHGGRA